MAGVRGEQDRRAPITLRACTVQDDAFLLRVYTSVRAQELARTGWDAAQQGAFVQMQHQAQRRAYQARFPAAEHRIIRRAAEDVGRLIVDRGGDAVWLVDISLLPEHRNAGLGALLIRQLQAEAAHAGKPVKLHVDKTNRAQRLYRRLGFAQTADGAIYVEMTWRPDAGQAGLKGG